MTATITTPCREWHDATTKGYGVRWDRQQKKVVLLHRWVVAQIHGWDAIEGQSVMHLCDNPPCYRYDHLRIGTRDDNMLDAWEKGRTAGAFVGGRSHCKHGHEFTLTNTYINPDGDRECRRCRADAQARYTARKEN